ncbi:hypothetical protein [Roseomonas sp. WA12]
MTLRLPPGRIRVIATQEVFDPSAGRRVAVVHYESAAGPRMVTMSVERCAELGLFQAAREGREAYLPER